MLEESSHKGHRHRLRTRFLKDLGQSMPDYELLELILTQAVPRRDMKPLSRALLKQFGSLGHLFSAPVATLQEVEGMGEATAAALKIIHVANQYMLAQSIENTHILSSWQNIIDYCLVCIAHEPSEKMHAIFLDKRHYVIANQVISSGTIDEVQIYPREIAKMALNYNASALILVHNHPSGNLNPSKGDIQATEILQESLLHLDIALHDHLIISSEGYTSFRNKGLLSEDF